MIKSFLCRMPYPHFLILRLQDIDELFDVFDTDGGGAIGYTAHSTNTSYSCVHLRKGCAFYSIFTDLIYAFILRYPELRKMLSAQPATEVPTAVKPKKVRAVASGVHVWLGRGLRLWAARVRESLLLLPALATLHAYCLHIRDRLLHQLRKSERRLQGKYREAVALPGVYLVCILVQIHT